jgi:hypothetical protein
VLPTNLRFQANICSELFENFGSLDAYNAIILEEIHFFFYMKNIYLILYNCENEKMIYLILEIK